MFILRPPSTKAYEISVPPHHFLPDTSASSSPTVMQLGLGFFVHLTILRLTATIWVVPHS